MTVILPLVWSAVVSEVRQSHLLFTVVFCLVNDAKVEQERATFFSQCEILVLFISSQHCQSLVGIFGLIC